MSSSESSDKSTKSQIKKSKKITNSESIFDGSESFLGGTRKLKKKNVFSDSELNNSDNSELEFSSNEESSISF